MTAKWLQTSVSVSSAPDKYPQERPQNNIWLITYLLRIYHKPFNVNQALCQRAHISFSVNKDGGPASC